MQRLDDASRTAFLDDHPDWSVDGETLRRTFTFSGFPEAVAFTVKVAFVAEQADHHPDIDIRWNKVTLALTTHSEDALTSKDTTLATTIDAL